MNPDITSAIIQAVGTIIAAVIATFGAGLIIKKSRESHFHAYSDEKHDVRRIMRKANVSITIVVGIGDNLLEKYKEDIIRYIKRGICVNYLLQDYEHFCQLENYIEGKDPNTERWESTVEIIKELKNENPLYFRAEWFHDLLTASYIGIDIDEPTSPAAVIQAMIYQYHTKAEKAPITLISAKTDLQEFNTTVGTIHKMWEEGTPLA